jgi:hypothetical protein
MNATRSTLLILTTVFTASAAWAHLRPTEVSSQAESVVAQTSVVPNGSSDDGSSALTHRQLARANATLAQRANAPQGGTFDLSRRCYFVQNKAAALKSVNESCRSLSQTDSSKAGSSSCSSTVTKNEALLQNLNQELAGCPAGQDAAKAFYEASKLGASQGEVDAQVCYVQSQFQSDGVALTYSQQDIDDYLKNAPGYINSGLARGDWRIVKLLAQHGYGDSYNPIELITKGDVYRQYVMNRLLELGANGDYYQQLEQSIQADYLSPGTSTPPPLTQQQVADGLRDAQSMYRKYFNRGPRLNAPPNTCSPG